MTKIVLHRILTSLLSLPSSPSLSGRMLHAVIANIMLRFYSSDSFQLRFWQKVFGQLYEYLGKVRAGFSRRGKKNGEEREDRRVE